MPVEALQCPQCAASLQLDEAGRCRSCGATIRVPMAPPPAVAPGEELGAGFDLCDAPLGLPAPSQLLAGLWMLGTDRRVQQELANPTFLAEVRGLADAVRAATERASAAGLDQFEAPDWKHDYSPDEVWCFRLALDLTLWLAGLPGVEAEKQRLAGTPTELEAELWRHRASKHIRDATWAPTTFAALRDRVPQHDG